MFWKKTCKNCRYSVEGGEPGWVSSLDKEAYEGIGGYLACGLMTGNRGGVPIEDMRKLWDYNPCKLWSRKRFI